jgi:hypothetical protein
MPELWVNIIIVCVLLTCVAGIFWSGIRLVRLRIEGRQQIDVVQSRMSSKVSARSATLPAARPHV